MSQGSDSEQSEVDEESSNPISQLQPSALSVVVENSSDINIGPHLQYNGPVTIKQYITVHSAENLDEISNAAPMESSSALYRDAVCAIPPAGRMDFFEQNILPKKDGTNDAGDQGNNQSVEEPFLWKWVISRFSRLQLISAISLLFLFIVVMIVTLVIYNGPEYTSPLELVGSSGSILVPSGQDAQWEVKSKLSYPLIFEWTNPSGKKLTLTLQPSKYRLWTSGYRTFVRVYDVTQNDSGVYLLRAYNVTAKFEQWLKVNLTVYNAGTPAHGRVVACYVASWAAIRQGEGAFNTGKIDPTLCTHFIYAFATLDKYNNTIVSKSPEHDLDEKGGRGAYKKMTALKKKHPKLKVLLAIGGWDDGGFKYSLMAESPSSRRIFVASVSAFLRKYNFDGLDLHWLYPVVSWRNEEKYRPDDYENFVTVLKELREEFDQYGLLLTIPIGMLADTLEDSYDIPEISKYVDLMFAMCYAYHTHWEDKTGPNAPLYPLSPDDSRNVESGINKLLRKGAPPEKLVLGIPLYGRVFLLPDNYKGEIHFGIPAKKGVSVASPFVGEEGYWGYNEICLELWSWSSTWKIVQDEVTRTPYAYNLQGQQHKFLSYDDIQSIGYKVNFAMEYKLAGVMTWSMDTDDFRGTCSNNKVGATTFPLTRSINKAIQEYVREEEERETNRELLNQTSTATQAT